VSLPNSVRSRPIAAGSLGGMTCGVVSSGDAGGVGACTTGGAGRIGADGCVCIGAASGGGLAVGRLGRAAPAGGGFCAIATPDRASPATVASANALNPVLRAACIPTPLPVAGPQ